MTEICDFDFLESSDKDSFSEVLVNDWNSVLWFNDRWRVFAAQFLNVKRLLFRTLKSLSSTMYHLILTTRENFLSTPKFIKRNI
jgi:hypothetical protein